MAVVAVAAVNLGGLTRTVAVTRALLVLTGAAPATVVVAGWSSDAATLERLAPINADVGGILRAAGFLFFAYARIATLGEEVRDPARTIPRAIPLALGAVLAMYAVVAITTLAVVPVDRLSATDAPLELVVDSGRFGAVEPLVRAGAGIAALGVLLNLIPGISRTVLAMARRRELPPGLAHIDANRSLPIRAEVTATATVAVLIVFVDLREALAFSGVAVLTYYALTNASALRLAPEHRRWPRALPFAGLLGCVTLAAALPARPLVIGAAVLSTGALMRVVAGGSQRQPT